MTLEEVKAAHAAGKTVYVGNTGYKIVGKDLDDLSILCTFNNYCIGLTHRDGVTLNAREDEFFIKHDA